MSISIIRNVLLAMIIMGLSMFPAASSGINGYKAETEMCPACGSGNSIPAFYGYPEPDAAEMVERGELYWMGCVMRPQGIVTHYCKDCGNLW